MDHLWGEVEPDAVHPRLADGGRTIPASQDSYRCYDCDSPFHSLTLLLDHCLVNPCHCSERCLKCSEPITVYTHQQKTVRLHTCRRNSLRHQNADLHVLSGFTVKRLNWSHSDENVVAGDQSVILCDSCDSTFPQTRRGVDDYLAHSNSLLHNIDTHCRKCTMPQFKFITSKSVCCITHFCTKDSKSMLREIPID